MSNSQDKLFEELKQTEGYKIHRRETIFIHISALILALTMFGMTLIGCRNRIEGTVTICLIGAEIIMIVLILRWIGNDIFKEKPLRIYYGTVKRIVIRDSLNREIETKDIYRHQQQHVGQYYILQAGEVIFEGGTPKRFSKSDICNFQNVSVGEYCYGFETHNGERFVVK